LADRGLKKRAAHHGISSSSVCVVIYSLDLCGNDDWEWVREAIDATVIVKFSGMHAPPDAPMPTVTHTAQTGSFISKMGFFCV